MVKQSIRLNPSATVRRAGLAGALLLGVATSPSIAQPQQQHHTNTSSSSGSKGKPAQHYAPPLSQSQMANMLDDVSVGKSPTLPAPSNQQRPPQQNGMSGMRPAMGNIVRPPAGGMLRPHSMGQNMGMSHSMGIVRGAGMGAIGHGMMPMGTMGGGAGMGMQRSNMTGGGAGMGMQRSNMTGGGAANFMQQFKAKFGALMPAAGAGGEEGSGEEGESGGGMPAMPGGMPGGGGGMQAQLMQRLFQGQAPGGAAAGGAGGMPGGLGAMMGGMPGGAMGGMPMARPSARGMGMGVPSMPQTQPHNSQSNDVIKRPPGVAGITGGASSSPNRGGSSSTVSDLERQMEQQYGR